MGVFLASEEGVVGEDAVKVGYARVAAFKGESGAGSIVTSRGR